MNPSQEIIDLEKKYWQAMKEHDVDTAIELTRFPCLVAGPNGTRFVSEEEYRQLFEKQSGAEFQNVNIGKPKVELLGKDTAIISYESAVSGKKFSDISTWVRDGGKWICAFHMEAPVSQH